MITTINDVGTIVVPMSAANGSNIVTIYENSFAGITAKTSISSTILSVNSFIKNLKAYAQIKSLPEATMPSFGLEDSDTDKQYKILEVEWKSARKQLNLFIGTRRGQWFPVGSISLLNPSGYPYRVYTLMDLFTDGLALELGSNGRIGVQFQDVGWGTLTASDQVTIHGSYVEEYLIEEKTQINSCSNRSWSVTTTDSQLILSNNEQRKYFALVNEGESTIYLSFGAKAVVGSGIPLLPRGGSYEYVVNDTALTTSVWAISSLETCHVSGIECV